MYHVGPRSSVEIAWAILGIVVFFGILAFQIWNAGSLSFFVILSR